MTPDTAGSAPEPPNPTVEGVQIELPDISRLAVEPGDVLLVRSRRLSQAQVGLIKLRLSQVFPGHEIVCISRDADVSVIRPVVPADGPQGNFWFAEYDVTRGAAHYHWTPCLQMDGLTFTGDSWFATEGACEEFIRDEILGADAVFERIPPPHGGFTLHSREGDVGPDDKQGFHVICACGRGYHFGHYVDSGRLFRWLADHDAKIPCPHRPAMQLAEGTMLYCADCGETRSRDDGSTSIPEGD